MQPDTPQGTGSLPSRSVPQWERAILAQWFAATERSGPHAVSAAYVSERSQDDPKLRNKIVIAGSDRADIAYLVHRPVGENAWVLTCARTSAELGRFRTLPEALSMIQPNNARSEAQADAAPVRVFDWLAGLTHGR